MMLGRGNHHACVHCWTLARDPAATRNAQGMEGINARGPASLLFTYAYVGMHDTDALG